MLSIMRRYVLFLIISPILTSNAFADGVDSHWNDPGVTVRQPNVWSTPGILVTDPFGRISPTQVQQPCHLIKQCFPNGNCVLQPVCTK
jgi:hypothetical protein